MITEKNIREKPIEEKLKYLLHHHQRVQLSVIEILNSNNLEHYHEFPELPYVGINYATNEDEENDEKITPTIKMISNLDDTGLKIRCGGIMKEAFPSVEQVAAMIQNCSIYNVPLFTAGLSSIETSFKRI